MLTEPMKYGVCINNEDTTDNFKALVWELSLVWINALTAGSEAMWFIMPTDKNHQELLLVNGRSPAVGTGQGGGSLTDSTLPLSKADRLALGYVSSFFGQLLLKEKGCDLLILSSIEVI